MTPETSAQLQLWRQKAIEGTLTKEEMRDAIILLREDRVRAAATSTKAKAKKVSIDAEALLGELEGL